MSSYGVIKEVSLLLVELVRGKLEKINEQMPEVVIGIAKSNPSAGKNPSLYFYLYEIEENTSLKKTEKTIQQQTNEKGEKTEFFLDPPIFLNLKYLVTCSADNCLDEQLLIGQTIKIFLENPSVNNKTENIPIKLLAPLPTETRAMLWQALGEVFRPALFYQVTVELSSEKQTGFRRVLEREIKLKQVINFK